MPAKCCICPNDSCTLDKVAFFTFPREVERRKEWLRQIRREGMTVKRSTVICSKHFEERFVVREHQVPGDDGQLVTLARDRIKLTKDALPTLYILPSDGGVWTPECLVTNITEEDLELTDGFDSSILENLEPPKVILGDSQGRESPCQQLSDPFSDVYLDPNTLNNLKPQSAPVLLPSLPVEPEPKRRKEFGQQTDFRSTDENEFEIFGRSIAMQLKKMPLAQALSLQFKIQAVITEDQLAISIL